MIDDYDLLQNAVEQTYRQMFPIIARQPKQEQVEFMKIWTEEITPYRTECVRLHYSLIDIVKGSRND